MLIEKLHGAANSAFAKGIFTLISVSFLVGGMSGYFFGSNETFAAKVNGEIISQQSFLDRYNAEYDRRVQQEGNAFLTQSDSPEFINGIRQAIIAGMIDQELLRQYAKELNLTVSDEMIKRAIVTDPNFQNNGKFDNQRYQQMLQANRLTSDNYAALLRGALTLEQMRNGLNDSDFIMPAQQNEIEKLFFQNREARIATLSLTDEMAKQSVSDEEIKAYYEANSKSFVQPEAVKVQYLQLSGEDVAKTIQVTDVEINQYYQDNKAQFMVQRLADIQLANEQDAQAVYQELQNGAKFADVAKARSVDRISAEKGGDLGWVNAGEYPKAFEEAANMLEVGKYSQPINLNGSYHIVSVEERKVKPLADVKADITQIVRQTLLDNRYYAVENDVKEKAFEDSKSLEAAAQAGKVKVQETAYFSRQDVPAALNFPNVISAIFDSDISNGGVNSEPINVGEKQAVVVRILDHKAEGIKTYEEVKGDIKQFLLRQKAETALMAKAEEAVKALTADPTKAIENAKFGPVQTFNLGSVQDPILTNSLFAIARPQNQSQVFHTGRNAKGDVVVIALDKVVDGKLDENQRKQFAAQLLQSTQLELQTQLMQALRAKAKIEVNEPFINQEESTEQ